MAKHQFEILARSIRSTGTVIYFSCRNCSVVHRMNASVIRHQLTCRDFLAHHEGFTLLQGRCSGVPKNGCVDPTCDRDLCHCGASGMPVRHCKNGHDWSE